MRIGMRIGTSLLAIAVAVPMMPATVTVAEAQSLIDTLFRNPAKRKRAKRSQVRRAPARTVRKTVRRKKRRAAVQQAAPQQTAKKKVKKRRVAAVKPIRNVGFKNYEPEAFETVNIAGTARVVSAAFAAERALLIANPTIEQLPPSVDPVDQQATLERALGARALMPERPADAADPVTMINAVAADQDTALIGEEALADVQPAPVLDEAGSLASVNDAAEEGFTLGAPLDEAPRFVVRRDPRIDQLANASAAWNILGQQERRATGDVANAVADYYAEERRLIWTNGRNVRPNVQEAIDTLRDARRWALDPSDYTVPAVPGPNASLDKHMAFELAMTVAVAEYMRDAHSGRIAADGLSGYHDLPRKNAKLAERIREIAAAASPDDVLLAAHPKNRHFTALQDELLKLVGDDANPLPKLPKGVTLRAGSKSEYVPALMRVLEARASADTLTKHADLLTAYDGSETLPADLDPFVRDVQRDNGLSADGIIGPRSAAALNGESNATKIERIELAMERMRWIPDVMGSEYVMINQPSYRVQHYRDDDVAISMRVVVGKPANQTNFFVDEISHIEFNPDWGVPRSIIVNEYLPRLQRDPGYMDRKGWIVRDGRGRRVSSSRVNWARYGANVPYSISQPPGPSNALGELKIEFPNRHAIYMHDTNAKGLFGNRQRAYSHGCIRLHKPREMAASVLGTDLADVKRRLRKGHHNAKVDRKIPVVIGYFTAFTKDDGSIGYFGDVYGRDRALKKALEKTRAARRGEA